MAVNEEKMVKRRGVVFGAARFGVLGLIGGLAVFGEAKRQRLVREGKCIGGGVCGGCGVFSDCGLPQAMTVKQGRLEAGDKGGSDER